MCLLGLNSSQGLLLSFPSPPHSLLSSGFILTDQGVFCQVSPIKFVLCGHLRAPRCLGIPPANETEAPIRISRLPPSRDFHSFFPLFRCLLLFLPTFPYSRCFRQKSSSFMRLAMCGISPTFWLTRRNADSVRLMADYRDRVVLCIRICTSRV